MKKNLLLIVLLGTLSFTAHSQVDIGGYEPVRIPPNPTAWQLSTFGNIPVINCTGTFSYSIPIYTIDYKDITLPITLNYGSNGVKVDQQASITGTDWSINLGGIVSRVMMGRADEDYERWYPNNIDAATLNANPGIIVALGTGQSITRDTEQDWFSFNANGLSGTFFFDEQLNIHVNCEEYVEIEFTPSSPSKVSAFTITDNKGYKYIFGGGNGYTESSSSIRAKPGYPDQFYETVLPYTSSWYLKEIISPTFNKITFSYSGYNSLTDITLSESVVFAEGDTPAQYGFSKGQTLQTTNFDVPLLRKICFANDSIVFGYKGNTNYTGGMYLNDIAIKHAGETLKKVSLEYDIIQGIGNFPDSIGTNIKTRNRLFLNNVSFADKTNAVIEKYQFEYYNLNNIPARFSYAKDKFGYPGNSSNTSPFSKKVWDEFLSEHRPFLGNYSHIFTADIEVDPVKVYTGMLKKITYPTGGYTEIIYEANFSKEKLLNDKKNTILLEAYTGCNNPNPNAVNTGFFVIGSDFVYDQAMEIKAKAQYENRNCTQKDDANFLISIKNMRTKTVLRSTPLGYSWDGVRETTVDALLSLSNTTNKTGDTIRIEITVPNSSSIVSGSILATVSYTRRMWEDTYIYNGGARIKEITDYSETKGYNKRKFYYNALAKYPSEESMMTSPDLYEYVRSSTLVVNTSPAWALPVYAFRQQLIVTPNPLFVYSKSRSQSTNYSIITELFETNGISNGAIERSFKNSIGDYETGHFHGPIPVSNAPHSNVNEVLKDKLETEKTFRKQGANYVLASRKNYKYQLLSEKKIPSYVFSCSNRRIDITSNINNKIQYISIARYENYIQNYKLTQIVDSIFESNGNIVNTTDYAYSSFPYFNLNQQKEVMSDNSQLVINYRYASEMNGQLANMDKLMAAKRFGEPVVIEKMKNSNIPVSAIKKEYKYENNMVLPRAIYNKFGSNSYYACVSFDKYDLTGNVLQSTDSLSTMPTTYLWGYNNRYLIAEIKNATYSDVCKKIGGGIEATGKTRLDTIANKQEPSSTDFSDINILRTQLPNAMVTTYTYKPLVGVTTIIDPSYRKVTYEYDPFSRLQFIKDHNEKIVERYDYRYKNP